MASWGKATVSPLQLLLGALRTDEALVRGVRDCHPVSMHQIVVGPHFPFVKVPYVFRYAYEDPGRARARPVTFLPAGYRIDPLYVEGVGLFQLHFILGPV